MKFVMLVLSCLFLVSCVSEEAPKTKNLKAPFRGGDLSRISVGMPKTEVIGQIGEPFSVAGKNDIELFIYRDDQKSGRSDYFVRFIDGKVESFGSQNLDQPTTPTNTLVKPKP